MGKFEKNKENGTRHIYAPLNLRQRGDFSCSKF